MPRPMFTTTLPNQQEDIDLYYPQPVHSGTVAECMKWVMAKRDYQATYFMTVPLEAGFIKKELGYPDIEAITQRPDFPK